MGAGCCSSVCSTSTHISPRFKRALWIALAINASMFFVEIIGGVLSKLEPKDVAGCLIAVPIVNVFGFNAQSRGYKASLRGALAIRPLVVLLALGVVSVFLGDGLGAGIIFLLAALSAALRFVQDYNAYRESEKLRTLIDDLNLTSKLEYGAQPLRRKDLRAGPLFRQLVAQFCESPLAEHCGITLEQEEPAEQTVLSVDEALLARLLENLLNNSVRHNSKPVNITVHTRRAGERFCLTVADDGIGYPPAVLAALNAAEPAENAPHILGLYVVQQIAAAHGGREVFGQNTPHGAKAVVYLPLG